MNGARATSSLGLLLALCACVSGPDYHPPAPPSVSRYLPAAAATAETGPSLVLGADVPGQWWSIYQSPALNALVDQALRANPDLQSAQAALRAARETYYAQRASAWPAVDADYQVSREETPSSLASILSSNADLFTLHTAQLTVSYAPDVFGLTRREIESTRAQAEAQRFQTEAAYLTLTSNVVVAAITQAGLQDQLDATENLIRADRDTLDLTRRQRAAGEAASGDVATQEAAVAQAEQTLPPLQKQLAQQEDLLADLTGRFPGQSDAQPLRLGQLQSPSNLPLSLPSKLVDQRPDIRAAAANLNSASAQLGVAIASRLPNFALSANAGGEASTLSQLFANGNGFWALTAGVTQPIFDAGGLMHKQRGAEAALDQAKAQYRSAVLAAFQNVADTLQALQADDRAQQAAKTAERASAASLAIARQQASAGEVGSLVRLSAEQAYDQARLAVIQADAARLADTAALYQALGGGWWNRAETTVTP